MELSEQDITDVTLGAAEVNAVSGAISFFGFMKMKESFTGTMRKRPVK